MHETLALALLSGYARRTPLRQRGQVVAHRIMIFIMRLINKLEKSSLLANLSI